MDVKVGDLLTDRDSRRKGRVVEVVHVDLDSVIVQTVKAPGGVEVDNGNTTEVRKERLAKAYRSEGTEQKPIVDDSVIDSVRLGVINEENINSNKLKNDIVAEIMKMAEPGNTVVLDRISALESRVLGLELGEDPESDEYTVADPTVTINVNPTGIVGDISETVNDMLDRVKGSYKTFTGSAVSNFPSIDEVLEKVLPQTDSTEFEDLWDALAESGKNPHEIIIKIVYKLLTE